MNPWTVRCAATYDPSNTVRVLTDTRAHLRSSPILSLPIIWQGQRRKWTECDFLWLCCVFIVVSGLSNCPSVWGSLYTIYIIVQAQSIFKGTAKQFRWWDAHHNAENTRQHSILNCRKAEQSPSSSWGLIVFLEAPTCQNAEVVAAVFQRFSSSAKSPYLFTFS